METEINKVLEKNNIKLGLVAYTEMKSMDGYHMDGKITVNGKKAFHCIDYGMGGPLEIEVINQKAAQPLLDIMPELEKIKTDLSDNNYTFYVDLDHLFYSLSEEHLEMKALKKEAKNNILIKFEKQNYNKHTYQKMKIKKNLPMKEHILFIISTMKKNKEKTIQIWNFKNEWKKYTIEELEKL